MLLLRLPAGKTSRGGIHNPDDEHDNGKSTMNENVSPIKKLVDFQLPCSSSWWFQPIWSFSQVEAKIKHIGGLHRSPQPPPAEWLRISHALGLQWYSPSDEDL